VIQGHSSENSRELMHQAHSLLEIVRDILPEEAFKKFEASLPACLEEMTALCQAVITSHQETLKLENDVSMFIELAEKTCESRVIFSGEIRAILPELERIVEERQDDEKFAEGLKASGHRVAFEIFNAHVDDLKYAQSRNQGYGFEL
jgi:uncharacterized protein (DUF2267 family)